MTTATAPTVIDAIKAMNARLESWLASLKATPTPKPPDAPDRAKPSPYRPKRVPMDKINDAAQREFIKNLRKQMLERAKREIEKAKEKVSALKRHLGEFTETDVRRWYYAHYPVGDRPTEAEMNANRSKAREAYVKYIKSQITYWEGFAKQNAKGLAQQYMKRFL